MAVILRSEKGSALTHQEVDGNFTVARVNEANVGVVDSEVTVLQGDVVALQADVLSAEADIASLQSDVLALQSSLAAVQLDVDKLGEVFIPATDFYAVDVLGNPGAFPRLGGASIGTFGGNGQTFPYQLFPGGQTGLMDCVGRSRSQIPQWNGQVFEVVLLGASHVTSFPFSRNFRILVDVIFVDEPANHLEQTLSLNFSSEEHVMGTFTANNFPGSPFAVAVRRDYDHNEDSDEDMYLAGIILRLV